MLRLIGLALAGLLALAQPLNAAGTVSGFSLTPQFDEYGKLMPGCKLYVIQAGTTQTPQNSYQDTALTLPQPNPLLCDASGRLPQFFVADGVIKLRLTNQAGSQKFVGDNLLVIGPSSGGGGGGGTVDPTTILATGDIKQRYGTGTLPGFVRQNGLTIGSATSGATERANSDCQALFEYLWTTDSALSVPGGRGTSANADWVANKTIALPDARGRALATITNMGNTTIGLWGGVTFDYGDGNTLGGRVGQTYLPAIGLVNLPSLGLPVTGSFSGTSTFGGFVRSNTLRQVAVGSGENGLGTAPSLEVISVSGPITGVASLGGSSARLQMANPFIFVTTYIKL